MRVLHIINKLNGGGAEKLVSEMLPLLNTQECQVSLLVLSSDQDRFGRILSDQGIQVTYLSRALNIYRPDFIFKIIKHLRSVDLIHVHLFPSQYYVVLAAMIGNVKIPVITTEHSTFNFRMKYALLKPVERLMYNKFKKIVCISEATKYTLQNWLSPKNDDKCTVIENGIDLKRFKSASAYPRERIHPGISVADKVIIMIARFDEAKDHETVLRAMGRLPDQYKLLLVGTGPRIDETMSFARLQPNKDNIIFMGFRNDIPELLKSSDIFVLSSNWDGFGLVAVEAMASGIPVIASDVQGLNEVVGGSGILFKPKDDEGLARIISDLGDSGTQHEIIDRQKNRADRYDILKTADKHISLYRELTR